MLNNAKPKSGLRFTIKQKLILNAVINISLMMLIGLYALNQMKRIGAEVEEVAKMDMPLVLAITNIKNNQLEQALYLERLFRLGSRDYHSALTQQEYAIAKKQFKQFGKQIKQELASAKTKAKEDIELSLVEQDKKEFQFIFQQLVKIDTDHKNYQTHADKVITLLTQRINQQLFNNKKQTTLGIELEQLITEIEQQEANLDHTIELLLKEIEDFTLQSLFAAEIHEKSAIQQVLILIIIGTILAFLGSLIIIQLINKPITRLKALGNKMASGDLSQKITQIANDELGDLSVSINSTVESISEAALQAEAIANSDFSQDITPKGVQDKLGHALHNMKSQIIERNNDLAEKIALNDGIVNTSLDAILSIDEQGIILSCNISTQRLFLYHPSEMIGKNIKMLMPMPFSGEHDSYLHNYKTTGIKKIIGSGREVQALKKDGSVFPIALSVGEVKQQGDKGLVFTGFIRDISLEKQFEADLQKNNEELSKQNERKNQLATINELTQGATELSTLSDDIISCLANACQAGHGVMYVRENQSSDKLRLSGSYAFQSRKNIIADILIGEGLIGQCAKEEKIILLTKVPNNYIQINSALGEQTPLNLILLPVLFESNLLAVIELASFHVFTKEQQTTFAQITQSLGTVINNIFNQQRTKDLLHETQQLAEKLQEQQEELKSSNENLVEQTQQLKASEEELMQQSEELKVSNEELAQRQKDLQAQKDHISASEQELTIKANELMIASKYKSEFLANMSHELRTPLNSLLLLAKGLADNNSGHLDEMEVEDAHIIYDGGQSLLALINDILDLSKVEAGKLNIHIEESMLTHIKERLLKLFTPLAKNKNLDFTIDISTDLPEKITTDCQRLEQILRNLLANAIKFTEMGSVKVLFTLPDEQLVLRNSKLSKENCLAIKVTDTGIGISEDKMQAIFEAFQQEDGSTSRKYGGTGLGLTIARELSHLLGGEIQLTSELHQGSCFTLYLPLAILPKQVEPLSNNSTSASSKNTAQASNLRVEQTTADVVTDIDTEQENEVAREAMKKAIFTSKTDGFMSNGCNNTDQQLNLFIDDDRNDVIPTDKSLLVIDDDKIFAKILRDHARKSGYKCLVAGDGRSGIYLAQHYQPNGIILDLMLPDIDGHQVLEQLKSSMKTQHIPVEIISAHSENRSEALAGGAIGLQTKPVSSEQLQQVLIEIENLSKAKIRQVLIIEDNEHHSTATKRLLENIGLKASTVDTGEAGCEAILSGKYDCVILDLGLPDMTGIELLQKVNSANTTILPPVIVYTGKEITDEEQAQLEQYSSTIVIKGIGSPERLLDDISLFLHGIEEKLSKVMTAKDKETMRLLHDEDAVLHGRRILLTDDDMRNAYALSKKLIDIGCDVEMANNGQEAIELLKHDDSFEIILMDTMMPVMDGNQATIAIRAMKKYKHIPIIALTAKTMSEDREQAIKAGASEYLTKPIDFEKLISILRIWLFKPH